MPRRARIDQPGLIQHVMARGIEGCPIFLDETDRSFFLGRLSLLLNELDATLLAWSLLTNHFHLLVRMADTPLHSLMERLLTAHAVRFNRFSGRSGHLFQNRYKSIVCREMGQLLENVRYLHLNPIRAGLVSGLEELDVYPWSGHAVLMGNVRMPGQDVEEVLGIFGGNLPRARKNYREFVAQGIPFGGRPELVEESNIRSSGSGNGLPASSRGLGSEGFLQSRQEREEKQSSKFEILPRSLSLVTLQDRVAAMMGVNPEDLLVRARGNRRSRARAIFCFLAVKGLDYSAVEVGRFLGMTGWAVGKAAIRGQEMGRVWPDCHDCLRLFP